MGIEELQVVAEPAFYRLLGMEPRELYEELGARAAAVRAVPETGDEFDLMINRMALRERPETLRKSGERLFNRLSHVAYQMLCGESADNNDARKTVFDVLGLGEMATVTVVASVLVQDLEMVPAFAAVVAVLLFRLVFEVFGAAVCSVWREQLV